MLNDILNLVEQSGHQNIEEQELDEYKGQHIFIQSPTFQELMLINIVEKVAAFSNSGLSESSNNWNCFFTLPGK